MGIDFNRPNIIFGEHKLTLRRVNIGTKMHCGKRVYNLPSHWLLTTNTGLWLVNGSKIWRKENLGHGENAGSCWSDFCQYEAEVWIILIYKSQILDMTTVINYFETTTLLFRLECCHMSHEWPEAMCCVSLPWSWLSHLPCVKGRSHTMPCPPGPWTKLHSTNKDLNVSVSNYKECLFFWWRSLL